MHVRIFRRTTRSVELTHFGTEIIPHVEAIVGRIEEIECRAEKHARPEGRLLRVAFAPIVDGPRLFTLLASYLGRHPGVDVIYKEASAGELAGQLTRDGADLVCGIRMRDVRTFGHCPLYREPLRYLPQGGLVGDWAAVTSVPLAEVARRTLILPADGCDLADLTRRLFHRQRLPVEEYPGHPLSYAAMQEWTWQGFGAAILPESKILGSATAYPLVIGAQGWPERITIEAAWRRSDRDRLVRDLAGHLKEAVRIAQAHRRH